MIQHTDRHGSRPFNDVLGFTFRHWRRQPARALAVALFALLAALGDVLTPLFAGKLVDAVSLA